MRFSLAGQRVCVLGSAGMVGSAIVRRLNAEQPAAILTPGRREADLTSQAAVHTWMENNRPDVVVIAAAKVGGILANSTYPVDFLYENIMIAANAIHAAHAVGVKKLLFLGSSCIYPRNAPQPMSEDALLTGSLEPTNEWYAIAKIAGIKLCQAYRVQHKADFISCQPTNLYGPGDYFDLKNSHVLPALLRKAHEAKLANAARMDVWGTGTPRREFLHVDDMADACVFLLQTFSGPEPINVGWGEDIAIGEVAKLITKTVGFKGSLSFDASKPDGMPRKLLDTTRINTLGWRPKIGLEAGLASYYRWFLENEGRYRA